MKYWNYDRLADSYDETRVIPPQLSSYFVTEIQGYIDSRFPHPPFNMLSIGLGTGRIETLLSSKTHQLFGIDIAAEMLKQLQSKKTNPPCFLSQADGLALPFSRSFQVILLIQIIHLIKEYETFFEEIRDFCEVLVTGSAYTETKHHPIYSQFFEILHDNGWEAIKEDEPKYDDFDNYMQKFDFKIIKKNKSVDNSILNSHIYNGLINRSYSSLWDVEDDIFSKSILDLDLFINENNFDKNEFFKTKSNVYLTFYEVN